MKILVVAEYSPNFLCGLLRDLGFSNVEKAIGGPQALGKLWTATTAFGLVICHYRMAPMDGLELLHEIRNDRQEKVRDVPFVMIDSETSVERVMAAREKGILGYIANTSIQALQKVMQTVK